MAVGGDSAGGNLAAVTALMARDSGLDLKLQMLVYPATDASQHYESFSENEAGPLLTVEVIDWFWSHYVGPELNEGVRRDWRFSPALAADHEGLAPAYIATCSADPLRDEGNAYAETLSSPVSQSSTRSSKANRISCFKCSTHVREQRDLSRNALQQLRRHSSED